MEARVQRFAAPAPWAEIVPTAGPTTVDELLALPDDGWRYEVVEGVLVRVAGSGEEAASVAGNIYFALRAYVQPRRLGVVTPADGVYHFPGAETGLLPRSQSQRTALEKDLPFDVGFYVASRRA